MPAFEVEEEGVRLPPDETQSEANPTTSSDRKCP